MLGHGGLDARGSGVGGRACQLALAAGGDSCIRTIFRRWGSRKLRDGALVRLDDTVFFPSAGRFVSSMEQLLVDSPRRRLVGGPNVGHLFLGELTVGPIFTVIPLEGFGNGFGAPIGLETRYNVFDFLVVVLAVLHHLKIRHDEDGGGGVCVCGPPSLMVKRE